MSGAYGHTFTYMYVRLCCLCWFGKVMNQTLNCDTRELWLSIPRLTVCVSARGGVLIAGRWLGSAVCFVSVQRPHEQRSVPGMEHQRI